MLDCPQKILLQTLRLIFLKQKWKKKVFVTSAPEDHVKKKNSFVTEEKARKGKAFAPGKHFQFSLIIACKAGANPSEQAFL